MLNEKTHCQYVSRFFVDISLFTFGQLICSFRSSLFGYVAKTLSKRFHLGVHLYVGSAPASKLAALTITNHHKM